uniref:Uncharacterized protein n=1 Tax=Arundo donax TaxID=35708 RepID=A0A0A8ZC06_ARUDO
MVTKTQKEVRYLFLLCAKIFDIVLIAKSQPFIICN